MAAVKRKPIGLILVLLLLFVAPFVAAWLLNASGWRPIGTRNYGELITPPENLSAARFVLADGQVLKWRDPSWTWTIFALAGPDCAASCVARIDELRRVRLTLNQNADRARVVVVGASLDAATLAALTPVQTATDADAKLANLRPSAPDQVAVAFVDPNGSLVLRYPVGYDGTPLRKDLARLIKEGF
jgi:hypothetical protein